jgi:thiol:disulfide interchange protein DsbD
LLAKRKIALFAALSLLAGLFSMAGAAADVASLNGLAAARSGADEFLDPDVAFRLRVTPGADGQLLLHWAIAPEYYLYRDRIKVVAKSPGTELGKPDFPPGITKTDEYFGEQVVYHDELTARVPVLGGVAAARPLEVAVTYQGCADAGLCYPPITKTFNVTLSASGAGFSGASNAGGNYVSEQDSLVGLIMHGGTFTMLAAFFVAGLLLAFTPCVLPMVPILSQLIAGQGKHVTTRRAFALSLTFVLGMALTYTLAGAAAAAAGQQVQALFQKTWVIILFAAVFVAMALSMFGLYTIQMPASIQTAVAGTSSRQRAGTFGGVAVMGALSALIVTTCVGPALVAALIVIGQSGDVARGASALFAMSLGMGVPLLAVGTSAGALLPKAGAWMDDVKKLFGAMMLAMAAWMLARVLPPAATLFAFAVPALITAWVLWRFTTRNVTTRWLARGVAVAAGFYGALLLVGSATGGTDALRPWARHGAEADALVFRSIHSVADLDREVQSAAAAGKNVMVDFYADWCVSCKEMERYTFTDPAVQQSLATTVLLRADVTANNSADQALLKRFGIYGPPTIAFYDTEGRELPRFRIVGYMKAAEFAAVLRQSGVAAAVSRS